MMLYNPDDRERPVNAPKYDYKCVNCGSTVESNVNESLIWACPFCTDDMYPMKKVFHAPRMQRVWHGHWDMTTGEYVTDYKKWKGIMADSSKERSERLGVAHNFVECDPNDPALKVTDEGMDATHDKWVELGWKESKGKFVHTMSDTPSVTPPVETKAPET